MLRAILTLIGLIVTEVVAELFLGLGALMLLSHSNDPWSRLRQRDSDQTVGLALWVGCLTLVCIQPLCFENITATNYWRYILANGAELIGLIVLLMLMGTLVEMTLLSKPQATVEEVGPGREALVVNTRSQQAGLIGNITVLLVYLLRLGFLGACWFGTL